MRRRRGNASERFRIFYTSDIHGSDRCFRKFLNAGKAYEADALLLGGDLTGKGMIPIVLTDLGVYRAEFFGEKVVLADEPELANFEERVRYNGMYPYRTDAAGHHELVESEPRRIEVFRQLLREQMRSWMRLADERLADTGTICAVMLGNDDDPELAGEIEQSEAVVNPEGRSVALGGGFTMVSNGWANITPWHSPRELPEPELSELIERSVAEAADGDGHELVFNLHCPPQGTGLDTVQKLDSEFRPVFEGGSPVMIPAGSTAVRAAIERHQPVLSLHGHIHEARGVQRIGRTVSINPGSDYASGQLQGVVVDLDGGGVRDYVLTRG